MALWKNSRYLSVDDKISAIDPVTLETRTTLGVRVVPRYETSNNDVHIIDVGEDIFDIAEKYYGDARLWWMIADANSVEITDPYNLDGITELLIPGLR